MLDVPVLIVFFNRSEPLEHVFNAVKNAKPSKLYLAQDGPRDGNEKDINNINRCRKIVECIDWDCDVKYNYAEKNMGCGKRMSSAISWAFETEDRLIILEDDCVPSYDFFRFADELLEKYKNDSRISMISAMNHLEKYNNYNNDSYIFCNSGAIWAWATWKREWDMYDFDMSFISKCNAFEKIKTSFYPKFYKDDLLAQGKDRYKTLKDGKQLSSWTFQYNMIRFLNHQMTIVPSVNMVSNVGLTKDSTHASAGLKQIPKGLQKFFYMPCGKMEFPMRHPEYMYCDDAFDKKVWRAMGMNKIVGFYRRTESIARRFIYGDKVDLIRKISRKILRNR